MLLMLDAINSSISDDEVFTDGGQMDSGQVLNSNNKGTPRDGRRRHARYSRHKHGGRQAGTHAHTHTHTHTGQRRVITPEYAWTVISDKTGRQANVAYVSLIGLI